METIITPETISYAVIEAICDSADYEVSAQPDDSLRIHAATVVFARLSYKQDRVQLATFRSFADNYAQKERIEFLRSVNEQHPLLRAKFSNTGALMISYEWYIAGGVTPDSLLATIEHIAVACADLMFKHSTIFK